MLRKWSKTQLKKNLKKLLQSIIYNFSNNFHCNSTSIFVNQYFLTTVVNEKDCLCYTTNKKNPPKTNSNIKVQITGCTNNNLSTTYLNLNVLRYPGYN